MENIGPTVSRYGLDSLGLTNVARVYWNLPPARLYEEALARREARVAAAGPLVASTGAHTGRSPKDKFTVRDATTDGEIWWGNNKEVSPATFAGLWSKAQQHLVGKDVFVFDGYAGTDPRYRLRVRIVTAYAWHSLFARNMFVREERPEVLADFEPEFTVVDVPGLKADPAVDGTASSTFILLDLTGRRVLIGGTEYAGEIKKSIFTVMNYFLPKAGLLSMHCSANYGIDRDDSALFFGLSGTGKTTLSADPDRTLVGDDEHAWSSDGVFNIEGGCYAKVIRLDPKGEPEIYATTRTFGTVLENVTCNPETRQLDLDDDSVTENTRSSYPVTQLTHVDLTGQAGHPKTVVFLTADAFGVLPPIARLTEEQAMYHFLSGYTAKVAGTERGVTEPTATFSTCFGAPFLPLHPSVYATMLGERISRHRSKVWLINTGWTGGPYGQGSRMKLAYTRRMVKAALSGELDAVATVADPMFGLAVPTAVPDVPSEILNPRNTWADQDAYDRQAAKLAQMFADNFEKFADGVDEAVRQAGPKV